MPVNLRSKDDGQVHWSVCLPKEVIPKLSHQGPHGQLPCESLFTHSLVLAVKDDMAVDLLLRFVPSPFLNIFFSPYMAVVSTPLMLN